MTQIKGVKSLLAKIEALGGNAERSLEVAIKQGANKVKGDAKNLAPVGKTGDLRDSIHDEVAKNTNKIQGRVYTNKEYAPYVEFGTGQRGEETPSPPKWDGNLSYRQDWTGMPAQPFLYPALEQNKDAVLRIIKRKLQEDLCRLRGH